jgi:hypothetical protein
MRFRRTANWWNIIIRVKVVWFGNIFSPFQWGGERESFPFYYEYDLSLHLGDKSCLLLLHYHTTIWHRCGSAKKILQDARPKAARLTKNYRKLRWTLAIKDGAVGWGSPYW